MSTMEQAAAIDYYEKKGEKGPALRIYNYTKMDEQRFLDLIKEKQGFIRWFMNKFSFIVDSNRDDYYQEIICVAWKNFHSYQPNTNFVTWLYRQAEWAVLAFRKKTRRHYDWTSYHENFKDTDFDIPEEVDTFFEDYEPLLNAISDLPPSLRRPVEIYLQGEGRSLGKAAVSAGKARTYYNSALYKARQHILKNRHKYFDEMVVAPEKLEKREMPASMIRETRPVEMRDADGRFIKAYASTQAVVVDGFSQANVVACCSGKRVSHKGYRWNYVGEQRAEILNRKRGTGFIKAARMVDQIDNTGEVVKTWASAKEAADIGGFNAHCIRHVINGKYKEHRGFIWRLT